MGSTYLARPADLLAYWWRGAFTVRNLAAGTFIALPADVAWILDLFTSPRTLENATRSQRRYERRSFSEGVKRLVGCGLLVRTSRPAAGSRIEGWKQQVASAHYLVASRDLRYRSRRRADLFLKTRVASKRRPALTKRYPDAPIQPLPRRDNSGAAGMAIEEALHKRRTVRRFSKQSVSVESVSSVLKGTWGQTGWIDGGPLGQLVGKTSPSAGSLHPIECYLVAWNVKGLPAGLYHFDAQDWQLRLLKRGNFRSAAVRAASGQEWIGRAAFLCIMTAVFDRTLWKYESESALRTLWLDAGHLAQTFCLLATAHGLGPFTTAAIQDTYIEKLLGLDGVKEFPVYLCGAGVPRPTVR